MDDVVLAAFDYGALFDDLASEGHHVVIGTRVVGKAVHEQDSGAMRRTAFFIRDLQHAGADTVEKGCTVHVAPVMSPACQRAPLARASNPRSCEPWVAAARRRDQTPAP